MVAKNLPYIVEVSSSTLPQSGAAGSNPFLPFLKGSRCTVGALPVIGSALALMLGSSSPSHADNASGIMGGILGGIISQQMMQRPAAPVYVAPAAPVYVAPAPVYVVPSQPYYQPRQRVARPIVPKAVPAADAVAKPTKAETAAIEGWKRTLQQFGSDQDIIVLIAAHDTKHVIRDLSGTPQFFLPAQGCFPFKLMNLEPSTSEGRYLREVIERVEKKGNGKVRMAPCTAKNFGQYDLLIFSPDQIDPTEIRAEDIQPIADAVQQGSFMEYGDPYSKAEFEADAQARADVIAKDEAHRMRDKREAMQKYNAEGNTDISAIYRKSPATNICVLGAPTDPLSDMLKKGEVQGKFADLLGTNTKVLPAADANQVFMSVKQNDCDAVIGTKEMLAKVIPALERDNVPFDYHPDSITPPQMKELADANLREPTAPIRQ